MHVEIITPRQPTRVEPLILVEEISHRVINEYSQAIASIRLAAAELASADARAALVSAAKRLLTYADAHRALLAPPAGERADLGDYLSRLGAALSAATLTDRGIHLTVTTDSITLAPERCWRVALIIAELITNSVRHGLHNGPGHILVEVLRGETEISCRVSDDGQAPAAMQPGRGLGVVHGLASELEGRINWSSDGDGTIAELVIPSSSAEMLA